ncbi:unnamed protein product [Danaus chrysippus]|uniref:(African queen) hypothetical protein n=1 Tax=Danaus chrysippus TaxID=151541 RepID=A0A8J2QYF9_9NEOP|nr:unnamed protein product [Danaus chrysippus]
MRMKDRNLAVETGARILNPWFDYCGFNSSTSEMVDGQAARDTIRAGSVSTSITSRGERRPLAPKGVTVTGRRVRLVMQWKNVLRGTVIVVSWQSSLAAESYRGGLGPSWPPSERKSSFQAKHYLGTGL